MVPVMAGITLSFKLRSESRVGLVYVGDGATSTGAFHEGINFAAVQRCPLVVIVREQRLRVLHADGEADAPRGASPTRPIGYGVPGVRADGNDVLAVVRRHEGRGGRGRAAGKGVTLIELMTYRRKGHAEHDNQSLRAAGRDRALGRDERSARPLRARCCTTTYGFSGAELDGDRRAGAAGDRRRDRPGRAVAAARGARCADRRLRATRRSMPTLWYREGIGSAVEKNERAQGWGTFDG